MGDCILHWKLGGGGGLGMAANYNFEYLQVQSLFMRLKSVINVFHPLTRLESFLLTMQANRKLYPGL